MAAYAALVSLLNNIEQMMDHPQLSGCFDHQLIQPLLEKVRSLIDFMDANNYGAGSTEADDLEREIAAVAHAAEDVIESHIVDQIHAGTAEISLNCSLHLQQKIQDLEAILERANEFKGSERSVEEKHTHVVEIGETPMVGLDAEFKHLLHELTNGGPKSNRKTISIVGMGGTGKSTLAKAIYEDKFIKEYFHIRAWATVSLQHNAKEILAQLLSDHKKSSHDSGEELHKNLFGRRYLIILDDIWSVKAWLEVRHFFPDNSNGSRIVLTTRLSNVAKDCGSSPFMMKLLDKDNSWKLFCEKAFKGEPCLHELREVGEEIVKSCKGLALSIVVMGGLLLKSPRTVEYWKGVARDIQSISDSKEKQESLDVLSLSYNHLPPHLKPCFLYMGVFKEDSEIHVSNVVQLWVAEGFIKSNGSRVIEEIGEEYIKDLIDRNLISIGRRRKNGKVRSCGIHDLLRDLCIKVGVQQLFFHVDSDIQGTERRLIVWSYLRFIEGRMPLARSIMSRNISGHPLKQGLLRVFNYQENFNSAAELYENVNLRYLAYKQSCDRRGNQSVWELPTSVSLLWNLQTFIIKEYLSSSVIVAPKEIWKMRQLRHVKCHKIYLHPYDGQDELLMWENLQTLKRALNLRMCDKVCKIIPNIKKLYLCYDRELHGYDDSLIEYLRNLDLLHKLESLNLHIKSSKWPHPDTHMNKKLSFPISLKKLSLSNCQLGWEDLTVIGSLPLLQVLILGYASVGGEKWSPVDGQFLNLKLLKIVGGGLKYWNAEASHFPILEKLVLDGLILLKEIPMDIGDIPTLELIRVDTCSDSAAISAVRIKEENQDNDGLQVQLRVFDVDLKSLTDAVPINNVQLEIVYLGSQ